MNEDDRELVGRLLRGERAAFGLPVGILIPG
jgi:hypothetical protein